VVTGRPGQERTLALRALGLGDLLTALPALRGLRALRPDRRLVLATSGWLEPVAMLSGAVDGVLPVQPLGPIPGWPPELAVNLHGSGPQSTERLREIGPGELWAYGLAGAPDWDDEDHEVERWCRLVDAHGGTCDRLALDLPAPAEPPLAGGLTLVHPGGAAPSRRWPASRWSRVAEQLADAGHDVVVTGSAGELDLCRSVAAGAGLADQAVLAGRLDLLALCAVVSCARLVVCADTGVGHLATAYRTRSVVLFGPVPPSRWGPPPDRPQHTVLWAGTTSDPFADHADPGLLSFTADDVVDAALVRV
jgi:ADP-heptose:LPS heptosyltransferase